MASVSLCIPVPLFFKGSVIEIDGRDFLAERSGGTSETGLGATRGDVTGSSKAALNSSAKLVRDDSRGLLGPRRDELRVDEGFEGGCGTTGVSSNRLCGAASEQGELRGLEYENGIGRPVWLSGLGEVVADGGTEGPGDEERECMEGVPGSVAGGVARVDDVKVA